MKKILTLLLAISLIICAVSCQPPVDPNKKSEGVMTHAEFLAAAIDSEVVIEGFVQAKQSWWQDEAVVYLQDGTGGYYIYKLPCTKAEFDSLTVGTKIQVTGARAAWGGMDEIMNVTDWKVVGTDKYVAASTNVTAKLGNNEELTKCSGMLVALDDMNFVSAYYADSGDIYVSLEKGGVTYSLTVEVYLTDAETEVYKSVADLVAGDVVDVEGFLSWYENALDMHITKITK